LNHWLGGFLQIYRAYGAGTIASGQLVLATTTLSRLTALCFFCALASWRLNLRSLPRHVKGCRQEQKYCLKSKHTCSACGTLPVRRFATWQNDFANQRRRLAMCRNGFAISRNGFAISQNEFALWQRASSISTNATLTLPIEFSNWGNLPATCQNHFAISQNDFANSQNGSANLRNDAAISQNRSAISPNDPPESLSEPSN